MPPDYFTLPAPLLLYRRLSSSPPFHLDEQKRDADACSDAAYRRDERRPPTLPTPVAPRRTTAQRDTHSRFRLLSLMLMPVHREDASPPAACHAPPAFFSRPAAFVTMACADYLVDEYIRHAESRCCCSRMPGGCPPGAFRPAVQRCLRHVALRCARRGGEHLQHAAMIAVFIAARRFRPARAAHAHKRGRFFSLKRDDFSPRAHHAMPLCPATPEPIPMSFILHSLRYHIRRDMPRFAEESSASATCPPVCRLFDSEQPLMPLMLLSDGARRCR